MTIFSTTTNPMPEAMSFVVTVAQQLHERTDERDHPVLNHLLSLLMGSNNVFERVAKEFNAGEESSDEDLRCVWVVFQARVLIQKALDRLQDDHLDWYADYVDETLAPFKDAILTLEMDRYQLETAFDGAFLDPDRWWGWLVSDELEEARRVTHVCLEEIWRKGAIARLTQTPGISEAKAGWCLDLAERHLQNLYSKFRGQSWSEEGSRRFDERCMWEHETSKETTAFWDQYSRPLKRQISKVASKLVRTSEEKLKRFEERLQYMY